LLQGFGNSREEEYQQYQLFGQSNQGVDARESDVCAGNGKRIDEEDGNEVGD
jgi:hypothetical protein